MIPDAPDVAEMITWSEREASMYERASQQPDVDIAAKHDMERDMRMLRAIAERLRRGGEHDGG